MNWSIGLCASCISEPGFSCLFPSQTRLTASEEQLDTVIDTLYDDIESTTMPAGLQQKLLNKVAATNHSIQVLYGVSNTQLP